MISQRRLLHFGKIWQFMDALDNHAHDAVQPVQRIRYADNETNYCAQCQTGGKVLADRSLSRLLGNDWPRTLDELEALKRRSNACFYPAFETRWCHHAVSGGTIRQLTMTLEATSTVACVAAAAY